MERENLVVLARALRRRATPAEKALWQQLRGGRFAGAKFRRQHPVGAYIADFFAPEARLVIELDGPIHAARAARDAERTRILRELGIRVLRFPNEDILHRLPYVLSIIRCHLTPLSPSPAKLGRGPGGGVS